MVFPTAVSIPPITDPLGRHWRQPDMSDVEITSEHAMLTQRQFDGLPEYSTSQPSGVYPGKCWKAEEFVREGNRARPTGRWFLRWFGICEDPKFCSNNQREIIFINQKDKP